MGRYMRYLMMFGPMLYRMYTKWSAGRSKNVDQSTAQTQQRPTDSEANPNYKGKDIKAEGDEFV